MMTQTFPVGLEEGSDGAILVHALTVPGCVAGGTDPEAALGSFSGVLARWLNALARFGDPVPPRDEELEIAVDEWIRTDAAVGEGESTACFEHDRIPLTDEEIATGLRRLGDLRGRLLPLVRHVPDERLDQARVDRWTVRQTLDELARAQWWLLSRLGATPLADVPERLLGRLDTAMALVVQVFTDLPPDARAAELELDGETWTPRKVMRRLLWLEWVLGNAAIEALQQEHRG